MFNYKRLSFIFFIVILYFVLTDTSFEKKLKVNLWSLVNVAVSEGQEFGDNAPNSILETFESGRLSLNKYISNWTSTVDIYMKTSVGYKYFGFLFLSVILSLLYYVTGYIIIFYPILLLILYFFLTSRFFKKEEFYD